MSAARKPMPDDRAALLMRGRTGRAVKRADEHLAPADAVELSAVPEPYDARSTGELDEAEAVDLATCERAVAGMQQAFTVAGKALTVISRARLYRQTHGTFAEYVDDRWGIKRAHAYRLMEAWPVAAALSPRGDIPEKHVRAWLPVVRAHGLPAARSAHEALQEQDVRVTTSRITEAVRALPPRLASPEQAGDVVRAAVAEGRVRVPSAPAPAEPEGGGEDQADGGGGGVSGEELDAGAEAVATMERAVAQQRQIYDAVGGGVLSAALLYDPGRGEQLRHELRQYASRTAYRMRDPAGGDGSAGE